MAPAPPRIAPTRPELTDGRLEAITVTSSEDEQWLRMDRGSLSVACNLAGEPRRFAVGGRVVLARSDPGVVVTGDGELVLPPDTVAVLGAA